MFWVNGFLIAQGEVVVVNDKFGIRLTDIVTTSEADASAKPQLTGQTNAINWLVLAHARAGDRKHPGGIVGTQADASSKDWQPKAN